MRPRLILSMWQPWATFVVTPDAKGRVAKWNETRAFAIRPGIARSLPRERVEQCEGGITDKIVRLVISDAPLHIIRELDYKALRELKRKAFHFYLDSRRPEIIRPKLEKFDKTKPRPRRPSLADLLTQKLEERALTGDIDRATLVKLGLAYLDEAETPLLQAASTTTESAD